MTDALARLDAVALARLVRSGEVSALEVVDATLARIDAANPGLNAVVSRRDDAARAEAASAALPTGPFRGVPMLLKDLWPSSAGDPMTLGNRAMREAGYRHPTDANITRRYREAGFVIVGRTNTPELGLVATTEPLAFGPTRNPWDPTRGPGGSSGGAAAAVAAGMVPAANASDGGGSIRIPAAMCGLVGLKPSRGRISQGPMHDEWSVSTQHVVCRTVRDCAAILDVTARPFLGDGVVAPPPARPYADLLDAPLRPLRVGLCLTHPAVTVDPACAAAARRCALLLETLGHRVEEAHPAILHDLSFGDRFGLLWRVNALASVGAMGRMLGRELGPDDMEPGTWVMAELARRATGLEVVEAQAAQHHYRRQMAAWWEEGWDLLLTPTTAAPPPPLGEMVPTDDDALRGVRRSVPYASFTAPFNTTGQPAISLPVGATEDGLPVGAQLVAAYGREDLLLGVAAALEAELRWADRRAPLHP
jgi:amidase